jgi:hypothetical protein
MDNQRGSLEVIFGPMFSGKCFSKNTLVRMYDRTTKYVQEVVKNDVLLGDDLQPRNVLSCAKGYGRLYRIEYEGPNSRESYTVNYEHTLSLVYTGVEPFKYNNRTFDQWEMVDLPLSDYLALDDDTKSKLEELSFVKTDAFQITHSPISIVECGTGEYFGFSLDRNHRFLLANGAVVHNSSELIRQIRRFTVAQKSVLVVKYEADKRYDDVRMSTHDMVMCDAVSTTKLYDIYEAAKSHEVIAIDEGIKSISDNHIQGNFFRTL